MGLYFGTPEAPCLTTVPIRSATFSVTSIRKDVAEGEMADVRLPPADAYFLMLYLDDVDHADIHADGTCTPVHRYERGAICLVDLEDGAAIRLHSRLTSLAFVLPKALFEEAAALPPGAGTNRLVCRRGKPDGVLANLGTALLALLRGGGASSPPALLRHMAVAICAHLLHQYGQTPGDASGDMPLEAKVKDEGGETSLALIASVIGLAEAPFLKDSRRTTPGNAWQMKTRVERAMEALAESQLSLETVARRSGFDDIAHFDKAFFAKTGMTPADWCRRRLN